MGLVESLVVPAESGLLLFVTPAARLRESTTYRLQLAGLMDTAGHRLPDTVIEFTTEAVTGGGAGPGQPGGNSQLQCATFSHRFSDKMRHLLRRLGLFSVGVLR